MKKTSGLFGAAYKPRAANILSGRFLVPPFSVLNTREGFWQDRKRQWIDIGIQSELGRGQSIGAGDGLHAVSEGDVKQLMKDSRGYAKTYNTGAPGDLAAGMRTKGAAPGGAARPAITGVKRGGPIVRGDGGTGRPLIKPGDGLTWNVNDLDEYRNKEKRTRRKGLTGNTSDIEAFAGLVRKTNKDVYLYPQGDDGDITVVNGGTSIFDPVLCECIYRWFCFPGGYVLDPFAGGSVRGIVAGSMGLSYVGVDLSGRQIEANKKQAKDIKVIPEPRWLQGNSTELDEVLHPLFEDSEPGQQTQFDLLFSCPPYGSLEVYSDDPADLSTMGADEFDDAYARIILKACEWLRPGAFACFVVGDYRDKDGFYCNLPAKTVMAFHDAGLTLYNEIILLTAIGSLPLRVNQQFMASRKVGKTHQNVLVFAKGQPKEFVKTWEQWEQPT